MILRPVGQPMEFSSEIVSAWQAVAASQEESAAACWLIAQPDHAALAGDLAAQFVANEFPAQDKDVIRAIALHDAGWANYDGGGEAGGGRRGLIPQPLRDPEGRALSFLRAPVPVFLEAWELSIECAEEKAGAIGGLMVSGHFRRLGEHHLASVKDSREDAERIHTFLEKQASCDEVRFSRQARSRAEVESLVDFLQFCDLLSLYLCCGSRASVQFPPLRGGRPTVLRRRGEVCALEPSPLRAEVRLGVTARRAPAAASEATTSVLALVLR